MIQEIFGVNEGIRRKCDHWAGLGYVGVAPDLFWRLEPGVELDPDVPEQFQQALGLMQKLDQDKAIADIEATIRDARARLPEGGQGRLRRLLPGRPARLHERGADRRRRLVGYYGVGLEGLLGEKHAIARPLHAPHRRRRPFRHARQAGADPRGARRPSQGRRSTIIPARITASPPKWATGASEAAARLADGRTEAFFAEHVG